MNTVTYSPKAFIPLTKLCRDVCHYCTFAKTPRHLESAYMSVEAVLELCHKAAAMGCHEALFTLGEKPELRYKVAREALAEMGYETTLEYVRDVAAAVLKETGMLPHINAGCMTADEIAFLRPVSASMGIMLESASPRLCEKGMPHYGSPDKEPSVRLETIELAGKAAVPFTTGILIGIGETREERIDSLAAIHALHKKYGHIQEIIIQNFRAKEDTLMAHAKEPSLEELVWTIRQAREIFGTEMNIQAPPNLSPGALPQLIDAGINDWGGVSPLTPDHVNPEAPWPHLDRLAAETAATGHFLESRLTIYPAFVRDAEKWLDVNMRPAVLALSDSEGYARPLDWCPGESEVIPRRDQRLLPQFRTIASDQELENPANSRQHGTHAVHALDRTSSVIRDIVSRCEASEAITESQIEQLFQVRGEDFSLVLQAANAMRKTISGDVVSYVVNRNINYTNVCYFKCQFCAFSKGKHSENLRGRPYDISAEEISRRCQEAWQRGATEVCMQGGIHPDYTGETYLDIIATVKTAVPDMHIHAFSPLEVWQGAETLGISLKEFLTRLKAAGLNTLPGTAAEILHDEVRAELCPDKLNSSQWLEVMETAHQVGFRTTATIMYGHIDAPRHWATHLASIRDLQARTGGFTEFVPLPYVPMEAPMYLKGKSRRGPTFREAVLMHAVARLVLQAKLPNIQASWVKMGEAGVKACLNAGANDLGGTLMNESITRAAGASHGQEWHPLDIERAIQSLGRTPRMRTTLYQDVDEQRYNLARGRTALREVVNESAEKLQRSKILAVG